MRKVGAVWQEFVSERDECEVEGPTEGVGAPIIGISCGVSSNALQSLKFSMPAP